METFFALLALCAGNSPIPGEFPAQRPVTRSFDVFFDLRLNKQLSKEPWGWWFEKPPCLLRHHCNVVRVTCPIGKAPVRSYFEVIKYRGSVNGCMLYVHYSDVIMSAMASQITGVSIVYSTICLGADQERHQSSLSLAFVRGIQWWPLESPHKGPVTRKM